MPIKKEQIDEWFENEVTLHFLSILKERLNAVFQQRGAVYFPFEAHKTQEAKALLIGAEGEIQDIVDAFEDKDLSQLEELDEQVGNTPSIGSSFN